MFLKTDSGKINKQEVLNMVHHRHPGNICCPDSSERLLSPKSVCDREKIRALHTQWTRQNSSGGSSVTLEQFLCQKLLQDLKDGIGNKNELLQILPAFFRETDLVSIVDCRQILSRSQSRESLVESWDVILGMERSGIMDLNRILPSLDNPEKIVEKLASQLIEWLEREGSDCDPDFEAVLGLILTKVFPLHYRKQNSRSQQSYDKVLDRTLDLLFQRLLGPRGSPGGKQFRRNIMVTVRDGCPLLEVRTKAAFQARALNRFLDLPSSLSLEDLTGNMGQFGPGSQKRVELLEHLRPIVPLLDSQSLENLLKRSLSLEKRNWESILWIKSVLLERGNREEQIDILSRECVGHLLTPDYSGFHTSLVFARLLCVNGEGASVPKGSQHGPGFFASHYSRFLNAKPLSEALATSVVARKSFVKFLTELVPFEPIQVLRVHRSLSPSGYSRGQERELWTNYIHLVMTRINDFAAGPSVNLSELKTHPREEGGQGGQESRGKTLAEVQKALLDFEREEHQIPTSVLLMANFKKGLFRGKFLPVLMSLPKTKTTRLFMENLLQKEKISKKLYENYMGS